LPPVTVLGFLFDDANEEKFADHGLSIDDVLSILEREHRVVRNRKERRASHMVGGRIENSDCIMVPIEPTADPVIWRPVTAWYASTSHQLAMCP
jgi:hypothetical protein